jgi:hypothetical protein
MPVLKIILDRSRQEINSELKLGTPGPFGIDE